MPRPKGGPLNILMASAFYPRGGSAQVVRYLTRALLEVGHRVQLLSGSLRAGDSATDARLFFQGLPLMEVDFTQAVRAFDNGLDPISARFRDPLTPSYEDKAGVPDRAFFRVGHEAMRALVSSWQGALARALSSFQPHVAHLHHLNHLHLAALALPQLERTPRIAHLHGTELKMLESMKSLLRGKGLTAALWSRELRRAAAAMDHFIAISPDNVARARELLEVNESKVSLIPNGVDTGLFRPTRISAPDKIALLREILVTSPHGWDESGVVGNIRYRNGDLAAFLDSSVRPKPLLIFVGRFLSFKRVPFLLEAVNAANNFFSRSGHKPPVFNLLVWGGVPGEWEGDHPYTVARRLGLPNVFFCGWLPHETLSRGLNVADILVAPSFEEPFGQVFLEAMASGLPVIAARSGGPLSFVVGEGDAANGWFCEVDDLDSLTRVLIEAVSDKSERLRRGRNALHLVRSQYSWTRIASRFVEVYRQLAR